jgi:hypothetical protein
MTYLPALFPPYRPERLIFEVREAESWADRRAIARLTERIYRGDRYWTPLAWRARLRVRLPGFNPIPGGEDMGLFLAEGRNGVLGAEAIGSIAVWLAADDDGPVARFGLFECINNPAVAEALLETAEYWVAERQSAANLRGPYNREGAPPGLLVDGFNVRPAAGLPYNPPYYPELLTTAHYEPWRTAHVLVWPADSPAAPRTPGIAGPIWAEDAIQLDALLAQGARRLHVYQVFSKNLAENAWR